MLVFIFVSGISPECKSKEGGAEFLISHSSFFQCLIKAVYSQFGITRFIEQGDKL